MAIVYQADAGLNQGITQMGNALGQALAKRNERAQEDAQAKQLAQAVGEETTLGKILSSPGGGKIVAKYGTVLAPIIKAEERRKGIGDTVNKWSPTDQVDQDFSHPVNPTQENLGPLDVVNPQFLNPEKKKPAQKGVFEEESQVVQTPAGTFSKSEFFSTPYGDYHPKQVKEYAQSPYPELQKQAEMVNQYIAQQSKADMQESAEIRKEQRGLINNYSKNLLNTKPINLAVNKMEEAKKLIKSGNVSLDDNFIRNLATGVLEGKGAGELAEIFKTPEQKRLYSLIYDSLRTKDLGGSNPSTKEVLLSLAAKPSPYKGDRENLAILNDLLLETEDKKFRSEAIRDLEKQGGYMSYADFLVKLEDKVAPKVEERRAELDRQDDIYFLNKDLAEEPPKPGHYIMYFPESREAKEIPSNRVAEQQKKGAVLINGK